MIIIGSLLTTLPALIFNILVFFLGKITVHHYDFVLYCRNLMGVPLDGNEEYPSRLAYIEKLLVTVGFLIQAFAILSMLGVILQLVSMIGIQQIEPVGTQLSPHGF